MNLPTLLLVGCLLALPACRDATPPGPDPQAAQAESISPPPWRPLLSGSSTEDMVRNTIVRYNELLAFGYQNLNMNFLPEVTTTDQAEKAYVHMAAIGEGKVRMVSRLKKISFEHLTQLTPSKVTATTRELWDFAYTNIASGTTQGAQTDFPYRVTYTLEQRDTRWLITDIVATGPEAEPQAAPPARGGSEPK